MRIKDLPIEAMPREKALQFGIEQLSDQELLALIIGSGGKNNSALEIAASLLSTYHSMHSLSLSSFASLSQQKGLKESGCLKLLAAFEFHNRLNSPQYQKSKPLSNAASIYYRYRYMETLDQEIFVILCLDSKKNIIKEKTLYKGTSDGCKIDIIDIIRELLINKTSYFALIHNHVDGATFPSNEDKLTTINIEKVALELGIKLFDHIIIYSGGYYSFKEEII